MAVGTCTFALGKDCALWLKLVWLYYSLCQVGVNAMAGTIDIRLGGRTMASLSLWKPKGFKLNMKKGPAFCELSCHLAFPPGSFQRGACLTEWSTAPLTFKLSKDVG